MLANIFIFVSPIGSKLKRKEEEQTTEEKK